MFYMSMSDAVSTLINFVTESWKLN